MQEEVIIIGAGPTGLMAAYELTKMGRKVLLLEARDRIGGRCCTYNGLELGAEFIHGELPIILSLLKAAGISYEATAGEWVQLRSGEADEAFNATAWPLLMQKLKALENDMSLQDFLTTHFADNKYASLKDQAIGYAEGYDTADTSRVSAKALCEEWAAMDEGEGQYRIKDGYGALMDYLAEQVKSKGGRILLSHPVSAVEVSGAGVGTKSPGKTFTAARTIIAMPLGALQREDGIQLQGPDAATYKSALQSLGFGDVIKIILRFREPFWEEAYPDLGFLLSGAPIPTWWTQMPERSNTLTGWLGGRAAITHKSLSDAQLSDMAITSLAQIFSKERHDIKGLLTEAQIMNWSSDPYTLGSYAYATVGYEAALQVLSQPMGDRLFFAGEYMYSGAAMGTVEAALWSGRQTAARV